MVDGVELIDGVMALTRGVAPVDAALRAQKGAVLLSRSARPAVGQTPHTIVHRQNKLKLRFYEPTGDRRRTPVVVVPSMINRAYICDLEPDRSLVRGLAERGHPTFLVDWGTPGPEDAGVGLAEVVLDLLRRSVDRACRHVGAERAVLLGFCQGGLLASMLAAVRPERVAGLIALATPVQLSRGGRFHELCRPEVCDPEALVDDDGLVSPEVMGPAFKLLDPMGNWSKLLAIEAASHDADTFARVMARERWLEENVAVPGKVAVELIRFGYQQDRLLKGTWPLRGEVVDLRRVTVPVLVTPCSRDFIAPAAACVPLAEAVGSRDVEVHVQDTGHIGVVVGAWGPKRYYPLVDAWVRRAIPEEAA